MEGTLLALVGQVFQPSQLYGEPKQHLVSVFTRHGHLITCRDLWGSEYFIGGHNISENSFQGSIFSTFTEKLVSGGPFLP